MKGLILLSHGSRRPESNAEMTALAEKIGLMPENPYAIVACAFQQFAAPTFQTTVDMLKEKGITDIVVLPLFLASGNHVLVDVPEMVSEARTQFPQIRIKVAPHLGQIEAFARFLLDQAARINRGDKAHVDR